LALCVPLSRFTSRVGGGSAFYVRPHYTLMKTQRQISDFAFGAIAIGAAPLIVFALVSFLIRHIGIPFPREPLGQKIVLDLIMAIFIVAPLAAIYFVMRWRIRHRVLPVSVLWLEAFIGLIAAAAVYCFLTWAYFYPSLTW